MTHTTIIDLSKLVAPINETSPTGQDLQELGGFESPFQKIKDLRNAARDAERAAILNESEYLSAGVQYWKQVVALAYDILTEHSKNLDVCAWLTEALTRLYGAAGLRDGVVLIETLSNQYWDTLFPLRDEDGYETRLGSINSLNGGTRPGTLVEPLSFFFLTEGRGDRDFALWQYRQALDCSNIQQDARRNERAHELGYTLDDIQEAANQTDPDFYIQNCEGLESVLNALKRLNDLMDDLCRDEAPSFGQIRENVETLLSAYRHLGSEHLSSAAKSTETEIISDDENIGSALTTNSAMFSKKPSTQTGGLMDREDAIKQLVAIATFFRATEPHSPIPFAIEKTVRWARMPFDKLMQELIPSDDSRNVFELMTGVSLSENNNDD
jgi:type VI secretion system protein ImpA